MWSAAKMPAKSAKVRVSFKGIYEFGKNKINKKIKML